jgi:transglutaminase-like putative cysteine protease
MKRRLADSLQAMALTLAVAAPLSYLLQISIGISFSFWYVLLFAAASFLLLELIGRNRITAIAIPCGAVILLALVWLMLGREQRQALVDFYWWVVHFITAGSAYTFGKGVALVAGITFLVTLYLWLFSRKFFFFPAVLVFTVTIILMRWLAGFDIVLVPGLLACGGLILLWAKSFQRKTAKKTKQKLPVNGIPLFLLPIAALMVLVGLVSVSEVTANSWRDKNVYDFFERVNNYLSDYTHFNRPRNTFSISAFGYMPMGSRLGGPVKLSDMEVLHVTAPRRMLLRGVVYNNYTGSLWTDTTGSERRRFGGPADAQRQDAFDLDRPVLSGSALIHYNMFVEQATIGMQPVIDSASTLFVPFKGVTSISSDKFLAVLPYYNSKGEAFSSSNLRSGYSYKVNADYLLYNVLGFDILMDNLVSLGLQDTPAKQEALRLSYLSLPDQIDPAVYTLAASITQGGENIYRKALAIKDYLAKNYHYTLTPNVPPENADFVSYFLLQDGNGYCTYFASAMTVLARITGIPARYVEGYMLPERSKDMYVVRGKNAHAWAELYFEGIGWIPFDATPTGGSASGTTGGSYGITGPPPTPTPSIPAFEDDTMQPESGDLSWDEFLSRLWLIPAAAGALALLWVIGMMIKAKARVSPGRVARRYVDGTRQCAFYYFEILRLLAYYNYPVKSGETPYAFATRIDKWLRLGTGKFAAVADLIVLLSYSDYKPEEKDIDFMCRFHRELTQYTYHTVGPWFYLWTYVLRLGRGSSRPSPGR